MTNARYTVLLIALFVLGFGAACEEKAPTEETVEPDEAITENVDIPQEYEQQAAEEITEANAEEAAAALEQEIEADL